MWENESLRLLVTVAETGSFTQAAARLNHTHSAVSRRIAALEHRADGPLPVRLPRGVLLTPARRVLHRHAVDVLDRLARVERDLTVLHAGHGGLSRTASFGFWLNFCDVNGQADLWTVLCPASRRLGRWSMLLEEALALRTTEVEPEPKAARRKQTSKPPRSRAASLPCRP